MRLWRPGKAWTLRSLPSRHKIKYLLYFLLFVNKNKTRSSGFCPVHSNNFYSGLSRSFIYIAGFFPLPEHSIQGFSHRSTQRKKKSDFRPILLIGLDQFKQSQTIKKYLGFHPKIKTSFSGISPCRPKGADLDAPSMLLHTNTLVPDMGAPAGKPAVCWAGPTQATKYIFDRNLGVTSMRQQSKTKREKRSVSLCYKQTIANKLYPSTVHSPQHSTVPVLIPRLDTPGVRLKGTRVST